MKKIKTKRTLKVKVTRFFQNEVTQNVIPWVITGILLYLFFLYN
jgi:hypothetical protein